MASGIENLDNNRFIIRYEHPWGGVASDAAKEDIQSNQLSACDGLLIRNGCLCSTNHYPFDAGLFRYSPTGYANYWPGVFEIQAIYTVGQWVVAIDRNLNSYYYDFTNMIWVLDQTPTAIDGTSPPYVNVTSTDGSGNTVVTKVPVYPNYSCSIMIKGVIYIFDFFGNQEFVYTPRQSMVQAQQGGNNSTSQGVAQTFVGGKYCMTVDHYLIVANTNMATDNPAVKENRYNWSGPDEFTTFGPVATTTTTGANGEYLDPNGILNPNTTLGQSTGYNTLPEVQQSITGCFAMGNVGYILHDQGLTQLTPTGVAIGPFDATLLWGSKDGIGCTMPSTFAIYGYIAVWGNGNNFYLFSAGSAPQEICGHTKRAIFEDINRFNYKDDKYINMYGQICNAGVDNSSPELVYNLYIVYESPRHVPPATMIVWSYVFKTQTWTRNVVDVLEIMQNVTNNQYYDKIISGWNMPLAAQTFKFPTDMGNDNLFYPHLIYGGIIFNMITPGGAQPATQDSFFLFQYINTKGVTSLPDVPPVTNLTFKTEEFQIDRMPTVRGVIIRAGGSGTLHVSVGLSTFSDIEVTTGAQTALYRSFGVHTDIAPTININSTNFNGIITKVHAFGTYAEGEPI